MWERTRQIVGESAHSLTFYANGLALRLHHQTAATWAEEHPTRGSLNVSCLHLLPHKQLWALVSPKPASPKVTASAWQAD